MYRIIKYTIVGQEFESLQRISDNAFIPKEPANTDYQAYLAWLEEGNAPYPADSATPTPADTGETL